MPARSIMLYLFAVVMISTSVTVIKAESECVGGPEDCPGERIVPKGPEPCEDKETRCVDWARAGHCKASYLPYMEENCAYSCGFCSPTVSCVDIDQYCERFAKVGHCTGDYRMYMMVNCKNTCNYCLMEATFPEVYPMPIPSMDSCTDDSKYCSYWAHQGYCESNPMYMMETCSMSCGTCYEGCRDMSSSCQGWSQYCSVDQYRSSMEANCMKTCNFCSNNDIVGTSTTTTESTCVNTASDEFCDSIAEICPTATWPNKRHYQNVCKKTCGVC